MEVQNSKEITMKHGIYMLLGPPAAGKTFTALTASEHFPLSPLPAEKQTLLSDVLVIQFDSGGLDGLAEQKLSVPVLDLSTLSGGKLLKGLRDIEKPIKQLVEAGTHTIIVDTLSVLDKGLVSVLTERYEKWGLYNALLQEHRRFFAFLKGLPATIIAIAHVKNLMPTDDDNQKKTIAAQGLTQGQLVVDITGSSGRFYRDNCSLIVPVKKKTLPGNKVSRVLTPWSKDVESKSRFACLAQEEPANMRLLFEKIRAAGE